MPYKLNRETSFEYVTNGIAFMAHISYFVDKNCGKFFLNLSVHAL
jgi:hypothetical protein